MTKSKYLNLELSTSPHVKREVTVEKIMRNVVWALLPIVGFAVFKYGISALAVIMTTVISCLLVEYGLSRMISKKDHGVASSSVGDYSALITGILLGLVLPPGFPVWMAAVGGVASMTFGKWAFGGLGSNPFNPALVGRLFLQAAFPVSVTTWNDAWATNRFTHFVSTTWTIPFMRPVMEKVDVVSGATPLGLMKFEQIFTESQKLFLGNAHGCIGEVSPLLILICGVYLAARKMLDWRIPVGILFTVFAVSGIFYLTDSNQYPVPWFMLFSGGLMLGAIFMATDMVSSPVTPGAVWLYGALIGVLIVMIRLFGGLPEGVAYAIVFANALVPIFNLWMKTRVYGTSKKQK